MILSAGTIFYKKRQNEGCDTVQYLNDTLRYFSVTSVATLSMMIPQQLSSTSVDNRSPPLQSESIDENTNRIISIQQLYDA